MPFKETMINKDGEELDACPFKFNVLLDEVETYNNVKLVLHPLDPNVFIIRDYYEFNESEIDPKNTVKTHYYQSDFFYNDEDDIVELYIFNGFDVAIFNICSLLGIGQITIDDSVPPNKYGFAPIHDRVSTIKFTLEEFKQLDGFVAWFKFTRHFILFKGLLLGARFIHESVESYDRVPKYDSDVLLRGEKLFLVD